MEAGEEAQASAGGRLHRPESNASSRSKYTPQGSTSSSANLQHRAQASSRDRGSALEPAQVERRAASGASLLQTRLREKKAARLSERRRSIEGDVLYEDGGVFGSPKLGVSGGPGREREGRPGSGGERTTGKKGMGIKEMEETVSTLHKQNFDLKLELFHRRQRQSDLEQRLEAAEARIAEQMEMQAVNEQLLAELEKRDQAVEEAVGVICGLEEKIERLTQERGNEEPSDLQQESRFFRRSRQVIRENRQDPGSSPPQGDMPGATTTTRAPQHKGPPRHIARVPSFLSERSEGTEALRSLYLPGDQESQSMLSLPKLPEEHKDESEEIEEMNSPRLSVLSESSFLSVYGDKTLELGDPDLNDDVEPGPPDHRRHRKSLSVERWIEERAKLASAAPKRPSAPKGANLRNGQFLSINDIVESPLQRLEKLERTLSKQNRRQSPLLPVEQGGGSRRADQEKKGQHLRRTEMTSFELQNGLPPTPDTISTSTLRMYKKSNDSLSLRVSDRELAREQPYVDYRSMNSSYSNLLSARPHSAGETVTSRREGHGWDTVTQSEVTDATDADAEIPSIFDPWIAMGREKPRPRIQPPDMFTFDDSHDDEWGKDMMFNSDDSQQLPPLRPYERSGFQDRIPRSEDTVIAAPRLRRSHSTDSSPRYPLPCPPLSARYSPNPPERRSSLAAGSPSDKRQRKPAQQSGPSVSSSAAQPGLRAASMNVNHSQNNSRRSRLTSRLFSLGRVESQLSTLQPTAAAASPAMGPNSSTRTESFGSNTQRRRRNSVDLSHAVDALKRASATPPPIARYPRSRDGGGAETIRPSTSSSLESNLNDRDGRVRGGYDDGFGVDGAGDERSPRRRNLNANAGGNESGNLKRDSKPQGRKWFGLGRSGSFRR